MKPEELAAKGRCTTVRGMAMELTRRYCGLTQQQAGKLFGNRDYSTMSMERNRFLQQSECDVQLPDASHESAGSSQTVNYGLRVCPAVGREGDCPKIHGRCAP